MQLHTLQKTHPNKDKSPRVGRGGKRGTTSGRGQKGQRAHGGRRIPTGMKEILSRLPKLRGVKNPPQSEKPQVLNLDSLNKLVGSEQPVITVELLYKAGLIKDKKGSVKILGDGNIVKAITLHGLIVSKSVKAKVEAAGGKVINSINV